MPNADPVKVKVDRIVTQISIKLLKKKTFENEEKIEVKSQSKISD